jgi:hypothetical protein
MVTESEEERTAVAVEAAVCAGNGAMGDEEEFHKGLLLLE